MQGLIGKKLGMTQVFDESGQCITVTVIEAGPCVVVQRKTKERDGYDAVQLGFAEKKEHLTAKSALGRFKKAGIANPMRHMKELEIEEGDELKEGDKITVSIFDDVSFVDVTGLSKGRGFQGVVKRHGMRGGRKTHGSTTHRRVGAIGQCSTPSRVAKGTRMPGQMGNVRVTQQNLAVVQVKGEDNRLLLGGSVPGPNGSIILVRKALKKAGAKQQGSESK
ncbi:50S ribosomal protein L3 [Verrucomicrobiota bacterium]